MFVLLDATEKQRMPFAALSQDACSPKTPGNNCCLQPLLYGSIWQQVHLATQMFSPESSECCHGPKGIKIA